MTDFADQLEEVVDPVFERASGTAVTVHLRPHEAKAVTQVAKTKRVRESTLLRRWVIEKLHATSTTAGKR